MSELDSDLAEIILQAKDEIPDNWSLHDLRKHVDAIKSLIRTEVLKVRVDERIKVSDSIKRQRENYKANDLFGSEYCEGMSDAALIAYDADKHGWFDKEGEYHAD